MTPRAFAHLCLSVSAYTLVAQDPPAPRDMGLAAFVEEVLRVNLDAAAQRFTVTAAEAQVTINRLYPDPELTAGIESKELYGPAKPERPTEYSAGLSWTLELGGKRAARIAVAEREVKKTQADLEAFLGELRAEAAGAFADALKARLVLARKQLAMGGFRELVRLNEIRHQAGDIGGVELTQSKVEARRFEGEVFAAQADLKAAEAKLAQLLGRPEYAVQAGGSLHVPQQHISLEHALTQALEHRPALMAARRNVEVTESRTRLAKANRWVDLGLNVGVSHTPAVVPTGLDEAGAPFPAPALKSNALNVSVSVPIPFSRRQKGELIQAESAQAQAKLQLQSAAHQTRADVVSAVAQYEAASNQLDAYRSGILQDSDKVLEGIQFSYKRGNASLLEWINAQRTNHEVHVAYYETLANHIKALVALDRVTGQHTSLATIQP